MTERTATRGPSSMAMVTSTRRSGLPGAAGGSTAATGLTAARVWPRAR
jgi:hypothetical protein